MLLKLTPGEGKSASITPLCVIRIRVWHPYPFECLECNGQYSKATLSDVGQAKNRNKLPGPDPKDLKIL